MAKAKCVQKPKASTGAKHSSTSTVPAKKAAERKPQVNTKQEKVLGLLRRSEGVTVLAIMKATGWQQHSVRGFLAGVVRKKLGLNLVRSVDGDTASYRITASKSVSARSSGSSRCKVTGGPTRKQPRKRAS